MLSLALISCGLALSALLLWVHVVSRLEKEHTAAIRSLVLALLIPLPYLALAWLPVPGVQTAGWALLGVTLAIPVILVIPTGPPRGLVEAAASERIDERTIMFSRAALEPGSERFEKYYRDNPHHRAADDRWRALPGLMSPSSRKFEPLPFAAAAGSFAAVEQLAGLVEGEPAAEKTSLDPADLTRFLKGWVVKLGAVSCGVAELRPEHVYSVKGRGERYGQMIDLLGQEGHRYAVAFTVEMDHANLGTAPDGPTLMESAQQYLASGAIAAQVAVFIRRLGWRAEAHIDANYKVVCPLVARDAGLGEIGRMGLLMTPELGPRVRIAVVTTDLPLEVSGREFDATVLHFCSICKKCADICPPRAIPSTSAEGGGGPGRWQIDQEACFSYWCSVGTDCGQCMMVCPYAHPDGAMHNLVRWGLKRSWLFRHFALRMDDLLYGRKPGPLARLSWLKPGAD